MTGSNNASILVSAGVFIAVSVGIFQFYNSSQNNYQLTQASYNEYLTGIWSSVERTWGTAPKKLESTRFDISFKLDKNGHASAIRVAENLHDSLLVKLRLEKAIEAASPFPGLPKGAPGEVDVSGHAQVSNGNLALELKIAQIEKISGIKSTCLAISPSEEVKCLRQQLSDGESKEQLFALNEIASYANDAAPAVPVISKFLHSQNEQLRNAAFTALQAIGPQAKSALPDLLAILSGPTDDRNKAAKTIACIGPAAKSAVPSLLAVLNDYDTDLIIESAHALKNISQEANQRAIPYLMKEMKIYPGNLNSLLASYGEELIPIIVQSYNGSYDEGTRKNALAILGDMGPAGKKAVPFLCDVLENNHGNDYGPEAATALGNIGLDAKAAVPFLIRAIKDGGDCNLRPFSAQALGQIGKAAKQALPILEATSKTDDPWLAGIAKDSIRKIETKE